MSSIQSFKSSVFSLLAGLLSIAGTWVMNVKMGFKKYNDKVFYRNMNKNVNKLLTENEISELCYFVIRNIYEYNLEENKQENILRYRENCTE